MIRINATAKADTTADPKGRTMVLILVLHRLEEIDGMAGMVDGVKPILRLPVFFTLYNSPILRLFLTALIPGFFVSTDTTVLR